MSEPLVQPFPRPPRWVRATLDQLDGVTAEDRDPFVLRRVHRPWEPASCPWTQRAELWPWLDAVAAWLNHEYGWQPTGAIPACWPAHPALVHELAVLACLRATAAQATDPNPLEEWHRTALPAFLQRLTDRLGTGCPPGRHTAWPAHSRYVEYLGAAATARRTDLFTADLLHARRQADDAAPPGQAARFGRQLRIDGLGR